MIEITAIRLVGGQSHEHITELLWRSGATALGHCPRQVVLDWLGTSGENRAVVMVGSEAVQLAVVGEPGKLPYLRARKDEAWTDDLLQLPRF